MVVRHVTERAETEPVATQVAQKRLDQPLSLDDIQTRQCRLLLDYWSGLVDLGSSPPLGEMIEARDLTTVLPDTFAIAFSAEDNDYRFQFSGHTIVEMFTRNPTGCTLTEVAEWAPAASDFINKMLSNLRKDPRPCARHISFSRNDEPQDKFEAVALPFQRIALVRGLVLFCASNQQDSASETYLASNDPNYAKTIQTADGLKPEDLQAIKEVFPRLALNYRLIGELFFERLFDINPALKRKFTKGIDAQSQAVGMAVSRLVRTIVDENEPQAQLRQIARDHSKVALSVDDLRDGENAFVWAIAQTAGNKLGSSDMDAWRRLYRWIMRESITGK